MMAMLGVASGRGLHFKMIIVLNSKHEPLQSNMKDTVSSEYSVFIYKNLSATPMCLIQIMHRGFNEARRLTCGVIQVLGKGQAYLWRGLNTVELIDGEIW